jgi:hypothetical protein
MSVVSTGSTIYYPGYAQVQVQQNAIIQQIASVSNSLNAVVVTTNANNYRVGQRLTFRIPRIYGMVQLNALVYDLSAVVIQLIDPQTFIIDTDTTKFTQFRYPDPMPENFDYPYAIPYASGPQIPPTYAPPLQTSFDGAIYNNGIK